ncbi:uncharacterized protein LOC113750749 [Coffea eugenioides]|uniref:uncharacterized protein LOC113750749 n=1 Tax=Coffea eugenioides TaxID=49369 RepID=UPI000F60F934|nr:uncharacterized protein LOC113750749 [Coffea eugenioides]
MRVSPFTDDINGERVLPNFKLPVLQPYARRGDHENHLRAFILTFRLCCVPNAVICQTFPIFLQGTARKWFWSLEQRSIFSLDELVDRIIHRFRFTEKNVQIPDQNEQVTIDAFTNELIAGIFHTEIHRDYPCSFRKFWERVDRGIRSKNLNCMKRKAQAAHVGQESRRKKEIGLAEQVPTSSNPFRDCRSIFDRIVKGRSSILDAELTPLNSSRSHILAVMRQNHLDRVPPEILGRREKRNPNLYCAYHRDDGSFNRSASHRDNRDLRREDRRGTKSHCCGPEDHREDQRPSRDGFPGYDPNIAGVINTSGGPTGGDNQNSRKRTYRQAGLEAAEPSSKLSEVITYGPSDLVPTASSNHESLVIEILINNYIVKKVYVDPDRSVDVLYYQTFERLKLTREQLTPVRTPLVGFGGHVVYPKGMVSLMVIVGHYPHCQTIPVSFAIVKADSPYNMLIGRPALNVLKVVYSTYHLSFKFSPPAGVAEVSSDVNAAKECYLVTIQTVVTPRPESRVERKRPTVLSIDSIDSQKIEKPGRLKPGNEVEVVILDEVRPDQMIPVGTSLLSPLKEEMINLIKDHQDVFAWSTDKVVGVSSELMVH